MPTADTAVDVTRIKSVTSRSIPRLLSIWSNLPSAVIFHPKHSTYSDRKIQYIAIESKQPKDINGVLILCTMYKLQMPKPMFAQMIQ